MWNKIKEFFISYGELCKASAEWMKKHWLGYIIVCCVIILPYWIWYFHQNRKLDKEIEELKKQEEESMKRFRTPLTF